MGDLCSPGEPVVSVLLRDPELFSMKIKVFTFYLQ